MLVGRLAMKKTRAQIAEELELNAADVTTRVADLRGKYNPEFQDILGSTRRLGRQARSFLADGHGVADLGVPFGV